MRAAQADAGQADAGQAGDGSQPMRTRSLQRTDVAFLCAAGATVAAGWFTLPVDPTAALIVAVVLACGASAIREPMLLAAAAVLFVGANSGEQMRALGTDLPADVEGVAVLVGDPRRSDFGWQVLLSVGSRRYAASVDHEQGRTLSSLATGDHVIVDGRPRPLRNAPIGWVRSNHLAGRLMVRHMERGPRAAPWYRLANGARQVLSDGSRSFEDERRPLYLGMVIGDDRDLSELREFRFVTAGLTHLSAVSGQNVGFVLILFSPLLTRIGRRGRWVATCVVLVFFVLVTHADPSVMRASVMAAVVAASLSSGRSLHTARALAVAVVVLLVVDPLMVHSLGFALSVTATLALVLVGPALAPHLPGPRWLRAPLAATITAQLATAPLLASIGSTPSPMSVPANLLAVPVAGVVMVLGMTVGVVAGLVAEPMAAVLQMPARSAVTWVDLVAGVASSVPCRPIGPGRLALVAGLGAVSPMMRIRQARTGVADPERRPWVRVCQRLSVAGAVLVLALSCWPTPPSVGVSRPAAGVDAVVGACGGVVLRVGREADGGEALSVASTSGLRRIDVLVVGRGAGRAAAAIAEQWTVRRRLDEGPMLGPTTLSVGGVDVVVRDGLAEISPSERPCRLGG